VESDKALEDFPQAFRLSAGAMGRHFDLAGYDVPIGPLIAIHDNAPALRAQDCEKLILITANA
jgi:hypothetical protein